MESNETTLPDHELLARSRREPALFALLVRRYEEPFLRKAERIVRSREAAQDVVQDAFTKIYLNSARYEQVEGATFSSWAYKILINTALTAYARAKRSGLAMAPLDPEEYEALPDQAGSTDAETNLLRDALVSVFSRMPRELARVLTLQFLDGHPQEAIAEMEGLSLAAVKTRVYRAKALFRKLSTEKNIL